MDYIAQMIMDPNQERVITIKSKPEKNKQQAPEAPISGDSANLPQALLDLLGQQQQAAAQPSQDDILAMLLGGAQFPQQAPANDPMMGQMPMDSGFNVYGG